MSFDEGNVKGLMNESLQISVIKKNIFDISVKALDREKVKVKDPALMDIINGIPLREFRNTLTKREDKEGYAKRLEEIVKSVLSQYLEATSRA